MGQYYHSVLQNKEGKFKSYYAFGLKLMEHSYFFNHYVNSICLKLLNKPQKVAWVGDYAESEELDQFVKYRQNHGREIKVGTKKNFMQHLLINHTQKQFIDLTDYYNENISNYYIKNRKDNWVIHPLPLLTAVGNGLGGGDYYGDKAINKDMVGIWAGDLIEVTPYNEDYKWNHETKKYQYKDYEKLNVIFDEGY